MSIHWIGRAGTDPGFIPLFVTEGGGPAVEQLHGAYARGGGWNKFEGFKLGHTTDKLFPYTLVYPGDPPMRMLGYGWCGEELIALFEGAWVAVIQKNETFEVSRMD